MRYESVAALLESAAQGVESAWAELFRRFSPLLSAVCRRHGVMGADAEDVSANVWLQLVLHAGKIRNPEALPGWLSTTARHECVSVLRGRHREFPDDREPAVPGADESLLDEERRTTVRSEVARLPVRQRELVSLLLADPPPSYAEISERLGMPVGAIGPTRQRCLVRLRRSTAIAALREVHDRSA
ncbi:RNA polymerase sigma factor [Lentzea pudingi]|uniref:RNA polymerase sigma factor n=1 Tax=Lentzea pudingi TaxID=1789439 RepID=A0ABQ2HDM0_9PSEU|nr:sigma-70 family RNA polymerase sigma factor [Lentzea pudingi]GGM76352.1 RNA polymerase sigma factor [Lentzea pudingi]